MIRLSVLSGALLLLAGCAHHAPPAATAPAPVTVPPACKGVGNTAWLVYFPPHNAELTAAARMTLTELANALHCAPDMGPGPGHTLVSGHIDRSENRRGDRKLGTARAQAVVDFLVTSGIDPTTLFAKDYADGAPLVASRRGVTEPQNRYVLVIHSSH